MINKQKIKVYRTTGINNYNKIVFQVGERIELPEGCVKIAEYEFVEEMLIEIKFEFVKVDFNCEVKVTTE